MKQQKNYLYALLLIASILISHSSNAQNAANEMTGTVGMSSSNSKFYSLSITTTNNNYNSFGVILDGICYSKNTNKTFDFTKDDDYLALGLFYKAGLSSTKNFNTAFLIGGSIGTNNSKMIYYPFGGFEENIFLSKWLQLSINEKAIYFLGQEPEQIKVNWQPTLNIGFKIAL